MVESPSCQSNVYGPWILEFDGTMVLYPVLQIACYNEMANVKSERTTTLREKILPVNSYVLHIYARSM